MDTGDARWLNRSSPSCLNSGTQRTDFFHGLLAHVTGSAVSRGYNRGDRLEKRRALMAEWEAYLTTLHPNRLDRQPAV